MNLIDLEKQAAKLHALAKNLKLANAAIAEYQEAAEENYQQALAEADKWQEEFEIALQARDLKVAHEVLLRKNDCKEKARKLEACIDKQIAQSIENLAILDNINKLMVTIATLLECRNSDSH